MPVIVTLEATVVVPKLEQVSLVHEIPFGDEGGWRSCRAGKPPSESIVRKTATSSGALGLVAYRALLT